MAAPEEEEFIFKLVVVYDVVHNIRRYQKPAQIDGILWRSSMRRVVQQPLHESRCHKNVLVCDVENEGGRG